MEPRPADPDFEEYRAEVLQALREGWTIVSEGPTGAQLKRAKSVRFMTGVLLAIGMFALMLVHVVLGSIFLLLGLVNHALTKEPVKFIPR